MVDERGADRARGPEVQGAGPVRLDGVQSQWRQPLLGDLEHLGGRHGQRPIVGPSRSADQVGVRAERIGGGQVAEIGGAHRPVQTVFVQPVGRLGQHVERVGLLRRDPVFQRDRRPVTANRNPIRPRREPVQGIAPVGLVDRQLMHLAVENVASTDNAIGPRHQHGAAEDRSHDVGIEWRHQVATATGQRAQAGPDRGDLCLVVPTADLRLPPTDRARTISF
ncbi:hypothetical protein SDC9_146328 [bioreactor metagenome]|uniref:Uncharacterized protein n=1 Tax=bioreactor metagenome TaxID=1076179 RepID=A0A645EAY2_9ZZZZ